MAIRVLVVDDDRDVAESLGMVLEGLDCEVDIAFTGEQAVERSRAARYDLTLLDVRLPGRNGVEVLRDLRAVRPEGAVAFVTGYSASALLDDAEELGAVAVLDKPVELRRLQDLLRRVTSE